jgi:hypothetical protein
MMNDFDGLHANFWVYTLLSMLPCKTIHGLCYGFRILMTYVYILYAHAYLYFSLLGVNKSIPFISFICRIGRCCFSK